jgi:hypothetical protein
MEYGKLQGEIVAAGWVAGASGTASLVGHAFNTKGVSLVSVGLFAVTLNDPVDPTDCANTATTTSAGDTVSANESGADTDSVKFFAVTDALGTLSSASGFYYNITRTNVP